MERGERPQLTTQTDRLFLVMAAARSQTDIYAKNPPFDGDHIEFWADFLTTYLTTSTGGAYGDKRSVRSREHVFSD